MNVATVVLWMIFTIITCAHCLRKNLTLSTITFAGFESPVFFALTSSEPMCIWIERLCFRHDASNEESRFRG